MKTNIGLCACSLVQATRDAEQGPERHVCFVQSLLRAWSLTLVCDYAGWCSRHMWWGCFAGLCLVSPAPCTLSAHLQTPESQFQVAAAALVILLPLFVMADPGEGAVKAIIILQNIVLGGFLAMLFWIFR